MPKRFSPSVSYGGISPLYRKLTAHFVQFTLPLLSFLFMHTVQHLDPYRGDDNAKQMIFLETLPMVPSKQIWSSISSSILSFLQLIPCLSYGFQVTHFAPDFETYFHIGHILLEEFRLLPARTGFHISKLFKPHLLKEDNFFLCVMFPCNYYQQQRTVTLMQSG